MLSCERSDKLCLAHPSRRLCMHSVVSALTHCTSGGDYLKAEDFRKD